MIFYIKNLVSLVICWIISGCLDYTCSNQVKECIYYAITYTFDSKGLQSLFKKNQWKLYYPFQFSDAEPPPNSKNTINKLSYLTFVGGSYSICLVFKKYSPK